MEFDLLEFELLYTGAWSIKYPPPRSSTTACVGALMAIAQYVHFSIPFAIDRWRGLDKMGLGSPRSPDRLEPTPAALSIFFATQAVR